MKDHLKFRNGVWTEEKVFLEYLKNLDSKTDPDGKVGKGSPHFCPVCNMIVMQHTVDPDAWEIFRLVNL